MELLREDQFGRDVVDEGRGEGGVGGEGDGGQAALRLLGQPFTVFGMVVFRRGLLGGGQRPFQHESLYQFADNVTRIGGAASIAADIKSPTGSKGFAQRVVGGLNVVEHGLQTREVLTERDEGRIHG